MLRKLFNYFCNDKLFQNFVDLIPHLAFIGNKTGEIVWYNKQYYEFTGCTFNDLKGWGWRKIFEEEYLPHIEKKWKHSLETGQNFEMTFTIKKYTGETHFFLCRVVPFRVNGKIKYWFGTNTDVTNLLEMEQIMAKLVSKNEALENFALVAAHDLQDPIKQNNVFIQMIQNGNTEALPMLHANNEKISQFVKKLLDYARSGNINLQTIDLNIPLNNAINNIKEISQNIKIYKTNLPTINGDDVQLTRVFQNLIKNGIKSGAKNIWIDFSKNNMEYTFSIQDDGCGIDKENLSNIFTIYRGKKNDSTGVGFGLAICKKIVESHNGKIWVESQPGKGTKFFFTIKK